MTCARETENKYVEHLEKIDRLLKKYAQDYHFYLRDLRSGQEYELGKKKPYPICSCFKLAVLMAFFDSLESESQLHEEVIIKPEEFSPGGGVLNYLTTPVKFTYFQLCQLMMAFSDGTATDLLIARVGIERIDQVLLKHTKDSKITKNLKEMVLDFQNRYPLKDLRKAKNPIFTFDDSTNAKDLADLANAAANFVPKMTSRKVYLDCLLTKKMAPRTPLFFDPAVKVYGKTGSFGLGYFVNDCGLIEFNETKVANFGITGQGFIQDKDINEIVFGYVGIEILNLLDLKVEANSRFNSQTRILLEK
jgi:beta-lactamase class A